MIETNIKAVEEYLRSLQTSICLALEVADGKEKFRRDCWDRPGGGGGESRVMVGGDVFEQAGVSFSLVYGNEMPPSATKSRPELAGRSFRALGISLVLHPKNPYVPATHANCRFFSTDSDDGEPVWWFGGGFDLTPYYAFHDDVLHWHRKAKEACDPFGNEVYPKYKRWCDDYFYLKHRKETRGVGGLFFDDLNDRGFDQSFEFTRSIGDQFLPAYLPIVRSRQMHKYGERQREFQLYRRGRYVEFNLICDRGTLFGLPSPRYQQRRKSLCLHDPPAPQTNSRNHRASRNGGGHRPREGP